MLSLVLLNNCFDYFKDFYACGVCFLLLEPVNDCGSSLLLLCLGVFFFSDKEFSIFVNISNNFFEIIFDFFMKGFLSFEKANSVFNLDDKSLLIFFQ